MQQVEVCESLCALLGGGEGFPLPLSQPAHGCGLRVNDINMPICMSYCSLQAQQISSQANAEPLSQNKDTVTLSRQAYELLQLKDRAMDSVSCISRTCAVAACKHLY